MAEVLSIAVTGAAGRGYTMWLANWFSLLLHGAKAVRVTAINRQFDDPAGDLASFDGILVGGGDDIGAQLYGGIPVPDVRIDPARDEMELRAIDNSLAATRPILGVCRGSQMLNVALGGSLHADIYEVYSSARRMRTVLPRKKISIVPGTRLSDMCGRINMHVNSLHHQSVDRLGDHLRVAARDTHGMIQAVELSGALAKRQFAVGVQWHPEFLVYRGSQRRIFEAFVRAAADRSDQRQHDAAPTDAAALARAPTANHGHERRSGQHTVGRSSPDLAGFMLVAKQS